MNVAVDTNIIVYVLTGTQQIALAASQALNNAAARGGALVVCAPVYAELLALTEWTRDDLDRFVAEANIRVDWSLTRLCWTVAGTAFAAYSRRRTRHKIAAPRRILADFIIGAHANEVGGLLTADASFYRTNFPDLRLHQL